MFIKLTKIDGTPVWIRAALVVTVEPDRHGGSVVVPLGDGLDYEVREKPEEVLAMLEEPASVPRRRRNPEAGQKRKNQPGPSNEFRTTTKSAAGNPAA